MFNRDRFIDELFSSSGFDFNESALLLFQHQAIHNPVYRQYISLLGKDATSVKQIQDIPFLPVQFFKTQHIQTGIFEPEIIFSSSSTTGTGQSYHRLKSTDLYIKSFINSFIRFIGKPEDFIFCAVLPSYIEREGSSLIYMVDHLINQSKHSDSRFYKLDEQLINQLTYLQEKARSEHKKLLLWGVTYALLNITDQTTLHLDNTIIVETGGMKGRRKEITRNELHHTLQTRLQPAAIISEYGMTELLSQAYSESDALFHTPHWMKVLIRNTNDPFDISGASGASGAINIIDLANIDSCAFIATDDIGRLHTNGFEVSGRLDNSDIRGCNLLFA
ncbi:MAG: acyl transferase [Bacteroidia bacterium]